MNLKQHSPAGMGKGKQLVKLCCAIRKGAPLCCAGSGGLWGAPTTRLGGSCVTGPQDVDRFQG